jgi:xylulose-5-phosphate/fructose-6-phosphate phosphoketolase
MTTDTTAPDLELALTSGLTLAPTGYVLDDVAGPLDADLLRRTDAWWRAANYLAVGQIYLMADPLLRGPLTPEHVKPRLLGHWGTTPGLNLVWAHANRVIRERDLDAVFVAGPGHGGPGPNACAWLEGSYSELWPAITQDEAGMAAFFRQFSFPGGVPSHCAPQTPGSFHEGGELGYSLLHAYGAALDHPDLTVFCVVGDGEAETGPLSASWAVTALVNPARDGAVVPILALNGYKIANPTVLARIPEQQLVDLLHGHGFEPHLVSAETSTNPAHAHQALAAAMDACLDEVEAIQRRARVDGDLTRPRWPMIVLRTPKGWTGPPVVDGLQVEGTFRAHQVPVAAVRTDAGHRAALEGWLRSYRPAELFDQGGRPVPELLALAPRGPRRMSANPVTVGSPSSPLDLPSLDGYGVEVTAPGTTSHEATRVLGTWLRDVARRNPSRFLVMGPDEVASNRLQDVLEVGGGRSWVAQTLPGDDRLSPSGRTIELLSEHVCQGLLEGYTLTGRHGVFTCYEAFVHVVDSMFNQHAKWLESSSAVPWRDPVPSFNYLLTSHVWRQDHNGSTHQDPGFLDVALNKKPGVVRIYLPPDANTLLSVYEHCLASRGYVNVVVAGKQPQLDYLTPSQAKAHCRRGIGVWDWAGTETPGTEPDVVIGCAGEVPTLEALAAADLLRSRTDLRVRVVNVVDLMRLQPAAEHPHGLSDAEFDAVFTRDRPVVFAFHGYPWLVHRLTYRRTNHANLHVRGFTENGTTTTPFDMVMLNDLDRYHLVMDVLDRVPGLGARYAGLRQEVVDARADARAYTREHGEDPPEIAGWTWPHR